MAKPIATFEIVAQAAEALLAEGKEPSLITIQERVGGSFSTIKRHLDAWSLQRQTVQSIQVPEMLLEQGTNLVREIWRAAQAQADQAVNVVRTEAERQVAVADQQYAEALAAIEKQETEIEAQTTTISQLQADLEQQRGEVAQAQAALATAQAQAQAVEQHIITLTQDLAQVRAELTSQARLVGEAEALRKQVVELLGLIERMGGTPSSGGTRPRKT